MNNPLFSLVVARSRELLALTFLGLAMAAANGASAATAATPKFSPAPGTYTSDQNLSMTDATSGAAIHYTTNGSTPTTSSPKYTAPLKITASTTVKAIAVASGFTNSAVTSGTYTIKIAATPVLSPAPGTYTSVRTISMTDATSGATIHYTTNGSTPTANSPKYTAPITLNAPTTIKAIAVASGFGNSAVTTGTYTIKVVSTPVLSPAPGIYTSAQTVAITDATAGAVIHYTTNGTTPTASSPKYTTPISIGTTTTTIKAIGIASGFGNSAVAGGTYTIKIAAAPVLSPAPGTYTSITSVSMTDATPGAAIHYTTDGTTPTASSPKYTSPVTLVAPTTIKAIAVASGFGNSAVTTGTYTIKLTATPVFSPAPGTYTSVQSISITDATSGAVIHYTTDGSTPTTGSPTYSAPISIGVTTTIKAFAVAAGSGNSLLASGAYTINLPPAPTPLISPATGLYGPPLQVTMKTCPAILCIVRRGQPVPTIYYTTDGSTPSPTSNLYSGPFTVAQGAVTQIKAISIESGHTTSAVASAIYTVPNLPSDQLGGGGVFLTNLYAAGTPAVTASCQYYQAVGAITGVPSGSDPCQLDSNGAFQFGISKSAWLANVYDPVANGLRDSATFININDLNFTRVHNMAELGSQSAAYVCNFPGADFYHDGVTHAQGVADQAAVDLAVSNAQHNVNPLPCVAIDYGFFTNVQGQSGMRFLAFDGKSGGLLPAANLDGRGAKAIPNACSACHGIPFEASTAQVGYQVPNGGRYIPFDEGNLVFSSANQLTRPDQENAIAVLNSMVLTITQMQLGNPAGGPTLTNDPIYQLIHAMYDINPCTAQAVPLGSSTQAVLPTPCGLVNAPLEEQDAYWAVYAPDCRSCHVANGVLSFLPPTQPGQLKSLFGSADVCNPLTGKPAAKMPNSKLAFDRFWSTHTGPTATPFGDSDYPYFVSQFTGCTLDSFPPAIP